MGLIDMASGKILIDTAWDYLFLTGGRWLLATTKDKTDAVLDTTGRLIVPPGRYTCINSFHQGVALVHIDDTNKTANTIGAIDSTGRLLFRREVDKSVELDECFYDGLIQARIKARRKRYQGYMNLRGQWVQNAASQILVLCDTPVRRGRQHTHPRPFEVS